MVINESLENIFASGKGILMALVDGRFLVAENASIDIEREYDYSGVVASKTLDHTGSKQKSGQSVTIEFDTRRDPYIKKDIIYAGEKFFRLYNQEYELLLENCFYGYRTNHRDDVVVSHVTVESAGELTISER